MFSALHTLAKRTSLTIAIVAEGDKLRIHVQPKPKDDDIALHPLSLLATPEELDAGFAQAVAVYEPSALSLLEQATTAANANSKASAPPAATAPANTGESDKGRPGRKRGTKAAGSNPASTSTAEKTTGSGDGAPFVPADKWPFPPPGGSASTPSPAAPAGETSNAQAAAEQQGDADASQNESLDLM